MTAQPPIITKAPALPWLRRFNALQCVGIGVSKRNPTDLQCGGLLVVPQVRSINEDLDHPLRGREVLIKERTRCNSEDRRAAFGSKYETGGIRGRIATG